MEMKQEEFGDFKNLLTSVESDSSTRFSNFRFSGSAGLVHESTRITSFVGVSLIEEGRGREQMRTSLYATPSLLSVTCSSRL